MSNTNNKNKIIKELQAEKQALQQQLQNMDVGFIVFIKSRIKKFFSLFSLLKIKSFKIENCCAFSLSPNHCWLGLLFRVC